MQRATFITSSLVASTCFASACASSAEAPHLVEQTGEFDAAAFGTLVNRQADIRQVWDAGNLHPLILGAVKNGLNGLEFGFGVRPEKIATAFVTHSGSNLLLYDDAAWAAYRLGDLFDVRDPSGAVVTSNIFAPARATETARDPDDVRGFYQDASISTLQKRGVMFFACNTALAQQAAQIAQSGVAKNTSAEEVAAALRSHLLTGVTLVPSGVAAVALLQSRHHYGYLTEQ